MGVNFGSIEYNVNILIIVVEFLVIQCSVNRSDIDSPRSNATKSSGGGGGANFLNLMQNIFMDQCIGSTCHKKKVFCDDNLTENGAKLLLFWVPKKVGTSESDDPFLT